MKSCNRSLVIVAALSVVLSATATSAQETATMRLDIGANAGCQNTTDPIVIPVVVEDLIPPGTTMTGAQFFLEWDPSCMQVTDIQPASWGFTTFSVIDNTSGTADYAMNSFAGVVGPDEVAQITVQPVNGSCDPCLTFRVVGPNGLRNKVGILGGDGEIFPPDLGLIPSNGVCLDLNYDLVPPLITCPEDIVVSNDPGECYAIVDPGQPIVSDDVSTGGFVVTCTRSDDPTLDCVTDPYPIGCTTLTWTAEDECGNVASCEQVICVTDDEPPAVVCPADLANIPNDPGTCGAVVDTGAATCTDNCPGCGVTYCRKDDAALLLSDPFPVGCTDIEWYAVDTSNLTTCIQQICVDDTQGPTVTPPDDITTNAAAGSCKAWIDPGQPICGDNCGCEDFTCERSDSNGLDCVNDPYPVGDTILTWTACDAAGHCDSAQQTITVNDGTPPVIDCTGIIDITTNADPGLCSAVVDPGSPTCTDNCGCAVTCERSDSNGFDCYTDPYPVGTTGVCFIASDGTSEDRCCIKVIVLDDQSPEMTCPGDIVQPADVGTCGAMVSPPKPSASDNCQVNVSCERDDSGDTNGFYPVGTTGITCTATDGSADSADTVCNYNVIITDDEAPVIHDCPGDINTNNDSGECSAVVSWPAPWADDNCNIASFSCTHDPGDTFPVGTTGVVCVAVDVNGNTTTCGFKVVVIDDEEPWITCPENIDTNAPFGTCEMNIDVGFPEHGDNCPQCTNCTPRAIRSDSPILSVSDPFLVGTTTVTWVRTDAGGNVDVCQQTITVKHGFSTTIMLRGGDVALYSGAVEPFNRPITFELHDCGAAGAPIILCEDLVFDPTSGDIVNQFIEVDPASYPEVCGMDVSCVTARDKLHSLRKTIHQDLSTNGLVEFMDLPVCNVNDDCWCDVGDFAILLADAGGPDLNGTTVGFSDCTTSPFHTDLDGDLMGGTFGDISVLLASVNWFDFSDRNCCDAVDVCGPDKAGPLMSITVADLRAMGVKNAAMADLTGDGVVDMVDVEAFLNGARPKTIQNLGRKNVIKMGDTPPIEN